MAQTPEEKRAYCRAYHEANREKIKARKRAYYQANREKIRARAQAEYRDPEKGAQVREKNRASYQRNREQRREDARTYAAANREAAKARASAWRAQNPERDRAMQKANWQRHRGARLAYNLRRLYGLQPEDWAALWEAQGGRCYLCGEPLNLADKVVVDHDHSCCAPGTPSCGRCVRGLAHSPCNLLIGIADDSPAMLRRMADALEAAQLATEQRKATPVEQQAALFTA